MALDTGTWVLSYRIACIRRIPIQFYLVYILYRCRNDDFQLLQASFLLTILFDITDFTLKTVFEFLQIKQLLLHIFC